METEYKLDQAISAAENEGMTGKVLPKHIARIKFDESALIRAEGEGMTLKLKPLGLSSKQKKFS